MVEGDIIFDVVNGNIYIDTLEGRMRADVYDYIIKGLRGEFYPCKKGADSNKLYMTFLQNHEIICHPSCEHVAEELENFVFLKDKNGYYCDDKTDHAFSHTLDALKYSYSDVYRAKKLSSINLKLGI